MKTVHVMKKIVYGLVISLLLLVGITLVLSRMDTPIGLRLFQVESGSMEPNIKTGSVIVVTKKETYEVNDVISFRVNGSSTTITHRIIERVNDTDQGQDVYRTKGDANEESDRTQVPLANVLGKVVFSVPYLGYPIEFAQTEMGFVLLVIVPATLIIYTEFGRMKEEVVLIVKRRKERTTANDTPDEDDQDSREESIVEGEVSDE